MEVAFGQPHGVAAELVGRTDLGAQLVVATGRIAPRNGRQLVEDTVLHAVPRAGAGRSARPGDRSSLCARA
jgi:hypothetical protein